MKRKLNKLKAQLYVIGIKLNKIARLELFGLKMELNEIKGNENMKTKTAI